MKSTGHLILLFSCIFLSWFPAGSILAQEWLPASVHRVVVLGDSITYSGQYVADLELFFRVRQPERTVEFLNLGLPSETVSGLSEPGHAGGKFPRPDLHERLARVLAQTKPDLVLACYGMNDGIYYPFGEERFAAYRQGIEWLKNQVEAAGAQIIFLTPPVFDPLPIKNRTLPAGRAEYRQPYAGYNEVLDRYAQWLVGQRKLGWRVIDVHQPMNEFLRKQREKDPQFHLAGDGVHINDQGHWLVAREILRAWRAPAEVTALPKAQSLLADNPNAAEVIRLIRKRQRQLTDAWLTDIGHKRPGMKKGLPPAEANDRATRLDDQIRYLTDAPARGTLQPLKKGYYRFPALHGETLVFTAEGDLWTVNLRGGVAHRLTTHPGTEAHAAISPDGTTVAFSAEYEGPTEVYTMPLNGGLPTRQTYEGRARVVGWTATGNVLYATRAFSTLPNEQLVQVDPRSRRQQVVPLSQASEGVWDAATKTWYFTRLPFQGSSTKRYHGGTAQNLWRFKAGDAEAVALTSDYPGTSKHPMLWQGRLYFVSDRDGTMNVWSMEPDGRNLKQHTHHTHFDVKAANLDDGRMVYQHGADLRLLDLARNTDAVIPIFLASDFDQLREKWIQKPLDYLTAAHLSPKGDRVVLTARGQVFVAPVHAGRFVAIPGQPGARYRSAQFLPNRRSLLALSDATGELEFWRLPANGVGEPEQLTRAGSVFRYPPVPSPDGKFFAFYDKNQELWIFEVAKKTSKRIAVSPRFNFSDLAWSPDSRWLAYVQAATNMFKQIHLYRVGDGRQAIVTSDRTDSYSPAWSPDGRWLYFLSDRELRSLVSSPWGARQPDPHLSDTTKIYQLALRPGLRSPFRPADELTAAKTHENATAGGKDDKPKEIKKPPKKSVRVTIDLKGLAERLEALPVKAGNYDSLAAAGRRLFWTVRPTGFDAKTDLQILDITNDHPQAQTLVRDLKSYELSLDGRKLLLRQKNTFYVISASSSAPAKLDKRKVDLSGWSFSVVPREEWRQIFTEAWRMLRDYFYDRQMHGLDWPGVLRKYQPLVDRVADRGDLSDLISEMVGELSALHIFVRYGDQREGPDDIPLATLGARLERDEKAEGWRVTHVYQTDPDYPRERSPLARPGVGIQAGDVIRSINGRSTLSVSHPCQLLRNQAGKQVLVEVRSAGTGKTRRAIVQPITVSQDAELRYDEWEFTRRQLVEQLGHGQLGYVHLRAMGAGNFAEWARDFYPVFMRQGLIIDVRHNRGGNIDSWILGKLLRKAWFYWQPRVGLPYWNMQYAFRGHVVVLCNERTASDGEAFSEGFRRLGLGKLIGTRTWGGEIWLSARRWLVDRGMATAAELGVYGPEGQWLIEGHGVDPDIVVDNLPHATYQGQDAQLKAAIKHLQQLIAKDPRPIPPTPKYPDKSAR